jgi:ribosomal silencing factor RsfS
MSDSGDVSQPVAWKSKLLESLGVRSAVVVEHGPSGHRCGLALTTALAFAVGAFTAPAAVADTLHTPSAHQQQVGASADQGKEQNSNLYDAARLTSTVFVGRLLYDEDEKETATQRTVALAGTALCASAAAPLIGAYMVYGEVNETYQFIQEREKRALDEKLGQVAERIARVQAEEVVRIRMEERTARASLPLQAREADHQHMKALVQEAKEFGLTNELELRLEVEQAAERSGLAPEEWYSEYKSEPSVEEALASNQVSARTSFMDGLSRMNSALDNQPLAAQAQVATKLPSLR